MRSQAGLPVLAPAQRNRRASIVVFRPANPLSNRILIVDDEAANVELLKAFLAGIGDELWEVTDSRLVEVEFLEFQPDIVLLDLHMPHVDGLEVLRRLRSARESLGYLPVVVLTADSTSVSRNSALILGADDFLTKPVDRQVVVLRVRNLLRTRHLFEELTRVAGSRPRAD